MLPTLRIAGSTRWARRAAVALLVALVLAIVAMLFLPWQQSIYGTGQVLAFSPQERPQTVQAPLYGRITRWNERIAEGVKVEQGEMILEISDIDEQLDDRLDAQLEASERKLEFAQMSVKSYQDQVEAYKFAKQKTIEAGEQMVQVARQEMIAKQREIDAARAAETQEKLDMERQTAMLARDVSSQLKVEQAQRKYRQAEAYRLKAEADLKAAENKLASEQAKLEKEATEAQAKVQLAEAYVQEAQGKVELARKDLADAQTKVSRQANQVIRAPLTGYILRLHANPGAEFVKLGDPLFTIVPDTEHRSVELYISGNDVPLVEVGRHVRLQFEGWPAVQFAGWPSVAVGTFGGVVSSVDATDNGLGQFRVLVTPDPTDQPWPDATFLRQGARTNGWVLLDQVSLGFEMWRILNGFPQAVQSKTEKETKVPKIKL
jgi:multidrug resistance efflux pump